MRFQLSHLADFFMFCSLSTGHHISPTWIKIDHKDIIFELAVAVRKRISTRLNDLIIVLSIPGINLHLVDMPSQLASVSSHANTTIRNINISDRSEIIAYAPTGDIMRNEAPETCAWCEGSGYSETESLWDLAGARRKCPVCNGQGSILVIQPARMCSTCNGEGRVGYLDSKCATCGGSGWAFAKTEEILEIHQEIEEDIAANRRQREHEDKRRYEDSQRVDELARSIQSRQASVLELIEKADYYIANDMMDYALKYCDEALSLDPKCSAAWTIKGRILEHFQKKDDALHCYIEAIWIDPDNKWALIGKERLSKDTQKETFYDPFLYDTRDGNELAPSVKAYLNQIEQANKYPNKMEGDLGTSQVKVLANSTKNFQTESSSWFKKGAKFIGLSALMLILGSIFYLASQNPELKFIELGPIPGFKNTDISNTPSTYTSGVENTYTVKIDYNGRWSGYTQCGSSDSEKRHISGTGTKTIENKLIKWPITADIRKDGSNSGILTVQIWKGDKMIKTGCTDNLRTRVKIMAYG